MMFTDAGESGYGGFMVNQLEKLVCRGKFTEYEKQQSSTFRELLAVKFVLQGYGTILKNQAIQINIDNYSATRILTIGSSKVGAWAEWLARGILTAETGVRFPVYP